MKNNTLKWISNVVGKKKINILFLALVQGVLGASGVIYALLLRNGIDYASQKEKMNFFLTLGLILGLVAMQIFLRGVVRWLEEYSRSDLENTFKSRLFETLLKKDYASVKSIHTGEWVNRLTSDAKITADAVVDILPGLTGMAVKMIGAFVMLVVIEPKFVLVLIPCGVLLIILTYAFRKVLKRLHKTIQEKDGNLRIFLQERLSSLIIVKSFCGENFSAEQGKEKMSEHKKARMKRNHFSNLCNIGFSAAMNGMYLVGFAYCGLGILGGTVTYGTLTAVLQLISQIQSPFANITGYLPKFYSMTASAERLKEAENFKDDCTEIAYDKDFINKFYNHEFSSIVFEKVSFKYDKNSDRNVINDFSLTVNKGENVAFTGQSGCGKSSLLKILMCLYKIDNGKIFLSDLNGKQIPLTNKWHRLFAYVPQENLLMNGTIKDVIAFSEKDADDEKIRLALKIACADEFVNQLENGVQTVLGERGSGLSEGQIQRIAIARAIYSDAPILLLDEATASLDEKTEKQLIKNINNMTNKTVLIVTHRPEALKICNKNVHFDEKGVMVNNKSNVT